MRNFPRIFATITFLLNLPFQFTFSYYEALSENIALITQSRNSSDFVYDNPNYAHLIINTIKSY